MMTIDEQVAFTEAWWKRKTSDIPALVAWLKKLHGTEIGGYDDYQSFLRDFEVDDRTTRILTNIAEDERKHAGLIVDLLDAWGHKLDPNPPASEYWKTMDSHIIDLTSACAVNYYGEALAAFRFEVIIDMPCTPADVKQMLGVILPDEQFHRQTLMRLAGADALATFESIHNEAMAALKR